MRACTCPKIHHQRGAEKQAKPQDSAPVGGQHVTRLKFREKRPPEIVRFRVQQALPYTAECPIRLDSQHAVRILRLYAVSGLHLARIVEPQRMRQHVVKGCLDLGKKGWHMTTRKRRVEEGQRRVRALGAIPDIRVVGVAVRGHTPGIRKPIGLKPFSGVSEKFPNRAPISPAVNDETGSGESVPFEVETGEAECSADVEISIASARNGAGLRVDHPLLEKPVDRFGGDFFHRDRVQRAAVDSKKLG